VQAASSRAAVIRNPSQKRTLISAAADVSPLLHEIATHGEIIAVQNGPRFRTYNVASGFEIDSIASGKSKARPFPFDWEFA
jgi:hypothetical protein